MNTLDNILVALGFSHSSIPFALWGIAGGWCSQFILSRSEQPVDIKSKITAPTFKGIIHFMTATVVITLLGVIFGTSVNHTPITAFFAGSLSWVFYFLMMKTAYTSSFKFAFVELFSKLLKTASSNLVDIKKDESDKST